MGPVAYSLCQKPVIGVVMWLSSLCAIPPLFLNEPISLTSAGGSISKSFDVPVEKRYALVINFEFQSVEQRLNDEIVGNRFDENCSRDVSYENIHPEKRIGLGRPIPVKVLVRNTSKHTVEFERTFNSLCATSHDGARSKTRTIGWIDLPRGQYIAELTNLSAQSGLEHVKTSVSLHAGHGK